jgi:endogenous inhibitor of DNA gyrase (YacG/DUF329 family)
MRARHDEKKWLKGLQLKLERMPTSEMKKIASRVLSDLVTKRLEKTRATLIPDQMGNLRPSWLSPAPLEAFYRMLWLDVDREQPVAKCPSCERVFVVGRTRTRFCSQRCATRARFARWYSIGRNRQALAKRRSRRQKQTRVSALINASVPPAGSSSPSHG